jgi:hypothetical protein
VTISPETLNMSTKGPQGRSFTSIS